MNLLSLISKYRIEGPSLHTSQGHITYCPWPSNHAYPRSISDEERQLCKTPLGFHRNPSIPPVVCGKPDLAGRRPHSNQLPHKKAAWQRRPTLVVCPRAGRAGRAGLSGGARMKQASRELPLLCYVYFSLFPRHLSEISLKFQSELGDLPLSNLLLNCGHQSIDSKFFPLSNTTREFMP